MWLHSMTTFDSLRLFAARAGTTLYTLALHGSSGALTTHYLSMSTIVQKLRWMNMDHRTPDIFARLSNFEGIGRC